MTDVVGAMTERLLCDAGVRAGMRVLDVGCGRGDVTLLAARLVGAAGQVVGADRDGAALATARAKAASLGVSNVEYVEVDLDALSATLGEFDVAVGRRVLMYQADPVAAVRKIASVLRPGGVVVFQEHDATMVPASAKPFPLHQRVSAWIWQTLEREGANLHMGFELASVFERAGLDVEHVRAEAVVQTARTDYPLAAIVRAMLPRIVERGVTTEADVDVDTLEQRLRDERARVNATYVSDMVFGAWARKAAG